MKQKSVTKTAQALLPTEYGKFEISIYKVSNGIEHVVLVKGHIPEAPLVRLHSACVTGDILFSLKCDCGQQLALSMQKIQEEGSGIILYLHQEGRGIGLTNKIKAYALQDKGYDTVEANQLLGLPVDARDYQVAAEILHHLGVSKIRLLTNNPDKIKQLEKYGIEVVEQVPLEIVPNEVNKKYLKTKKQKMSHKLLYV